MKYINEQFAMENGPFTDDLPIKNGDFHSYVCLPEGICKTNHFFVIYTYPLVIQHSYGTSIGTSAINEHFQ